MATIPLRHDDDGQHGPATTPQEERSQDVATPLPGALELPDFDRHLAPHLAIRSDGVVLLSVEDLAGYDLSRRKRWTSIELTPDEASEVRRRFAGAAEESVAHIAGKLSKKKNGGDA